MKKGKPKINRFFAVLISTLLFGTLAGLKATSSVTVKAAPSEPMFIGEGIGWTNSDPTYKMDAVMGEPDVYVKAHTGLTNGQYSIIKFESPS